MMKNISFHSVMLYSTRIVSRKIKKKKKEGIVSGASPGTTDGMDYRSMIVNIFGAEIM